MDALWQHLPPYSNAQNALAVVDGSGSMYTGANPSPIDVAVSLGLYFAEHTQGAFHNSFITFSRTPRLVEVKGENIYKKVMNAFAYNEATNTNLRAVFQLILRTAVKNQLPQSELPEVLYIISDMQFDSGCDADKTVFEEMKNAYQEAGYQLPVVVYWNVQSRQVQVPVMRNEMGVILVSGCSPVLFEAALSTTLTPERMLYSIMEKERYACITA